MSIDRNAAVKRALRMSDLFEAMTDESLRRWWRAYGRQSDEPFESEDKAALWVAVNTEMRERGFI